MSDKTITVQMRAGGEVLSVQELPVALEQAGRVVATRTVGLSPLSVGSGPDCAWVLSGEAVSRRHCELRLAPQGLRVKDLGSKNGTWVNGVRVLEVIVPVGGTVTIGDAQLRVLPSAGTTEFPLAPRTTFGEAVGASPAMRALFAILERVAQTDNPTLLLGETGTGKELLARALHEEGPRAKGPYVVFDCGATPPTLVESVLFGHIRGAFTGAESTRPGLLEEANGGTLFLDEVGELPLDTQTRLLRLLETRTYRRVGDPDYRETDVRIVAATHRNLPARVAAGQFREDLYYRLAVITAQVPPLRERKEDIPLLVERILARQNPPLSMSAFPPTALALLTAHDWPGNVRELTNTVTRLVLFPRLGERAIELGPRAAGEPEPLGYAYYGLPLKEARAALVETFEIEFLKRKLREHRGNVAAAARAVGVSRQYLHRLLDQYGLASEGGD